MALKKRSGSTSSSNKKKSSINVDFTGVDSAGRLADGEYLGKFESWEIKTSDNSGSDYIDFKMLVSGAKLSMMCSLQPQALWKLRDVLDCMGFEVPEGPMDLDLDELMGEEVGVIVENETYQGKKRPKIVGTLPKEDIGESEEEEQEEEEEPAKEEKSTTRTRKRTSTKEPESEFGPKVKVSFKDDDGKTIKGEIVKAGDDDGTWLVKAGRDEWEIAEDDLTKL